MDKLLHNHYKVWDGISSHTLLGMWLLIHAGIKVHPFYPGQKSLIYAYKIKLIYLTMPTVQPYPCKIVRKYAIYHKSSATK